MDPKFAHAWKVQLVGVASTVTRTPPQASPAEDQSQARRYLISFHSAKSNAMIVLWLHLVWILCYTLPIAVGQTECEGTMSNYYDYYRTAYTNKFYAAINKNSMPII